MPFNDSELQQLQTLLTASDGGAAVVAAFRQQFPGRSITRCDVSDMSAAEPYQQFQGFDLHFVDNRDHCVQLTTDPALATGVVLAKHRGA